MKTNIPDLSFHFPTNPLSSRQNQLPMETNKLSLPLLLIVPFLLLSLTTAHRLDHELSGAISALRSHDYNLFTNAVAESHLLLPLLPRNSTLTIFTPLDSLVFSPSDSLFRFISPFKLFASRLQSLSYDTCLNTLVPNHHLSIQRTKILRLNGTVSESVTVDGMRVSLPDLFIGSSIVVHGLDAVFLVDHGFYSKVLQIEKTATQYISSWTETGLVRSKNRTNETEILFTTYNAWIDWT